MKQIELTEEHRSKLIEMCKVLFPEYFWYIENADFITIGEYDTKINNILIGTLQGKSEMDQTSEIIIHWFEFCMTHLFEKIMVIPNGYESINDFIQMNCYFIYGHPVDYLYEEFKKLK